MDSGQPLAASAAQCANHLDVKAKAICARCGAFICESCGASTEPPLCAPCLAKRSIGLLSQPFSFVGALSGGWTLFLSVLGPLVAACGVVAVPMGLANWAAEGALHNNLMKLYFNSVLNGTIGVVQLGVALALLSSKAEGREGTFGWAMGEGLRAWPRIFGARFVAGLHIILWALLLVIPGIFKAVRLSLVGTVAYLRDSHDPIERSETLVRGRTWEILGLLCVAKVTLMLIGIVAGFLFGLTKTGLPQLAPLVHFGIANTVLIGDSFVHAVVLSAYYGLRFSANRDR